jgi:tRNA dimethylallyltransferase
LAKLVPKHIFILGATCTGKSKIGALLAYELNGEVISLDSMQVYKGLPILSAQPRSEEKSLVPHHLVDMIEPSTKFNVISYINEVDKIIGRLEKEGKIAVFTGGTSLYFKALVDGFDDMPPGSDAERKRIISEVGESPEKLHEHLMSLDPVIGARIHKNNLKKIIRAIEVCRLSGHRMSELMGNKTDGGIIKDFLAWSIHLPREELYRRIDDRVDEMMKAGAIDEVKNLWSEFGNLDVTIHQALGVRQLMRHFQEGLDLEECIELTKRDTRRFSKRQLSFLRGEHRIQPLEVKNFNSYSAIAKHIKDLYIASSQRIHG